jgi:hypothetical protein
MDWDLQPGGSFYMEVDSKPGPFQKRRVRHPQIQFKGCATRPVEVPLAVDAASYTAASYTARNAPVLSSLLGF